MLPIPDDTVSLEQEREHSIFYRNQKPVTQTARERRANTHLKDFELEKPKKANQPLIDDWLNTDQVEELVRTEIEDEYPEWSEVWWNVLVLRDLRRVYFDDMDETK